MLKKSKRQPTPSKRKSGPLKYFADHALFRFDEFAKAHERRGLIRTGTWSILRHHEKRGHLKRLRRGLYLWANADVEASHPIRIAAKLTSDGVLAYEGALYAHQLFPLRDRVILLSSERVRHFVFNGTQFNTVSRARALSQRRHQQTVMTVNHRGVPLRVTTLERTIVDCLDRLDLGLPIEQLWNVFLDVQRFDIEAMVDYAELIGGPVTLARVGLFLMCHPHSGDCGSKWWRLENGVPNRAVYIDRARRMGDEVHVNRWKLLVSSELLTQMKDGKPLWD